MNSAPTEVLVATAYITITIEGGIRMPRAPEVVITPAPKRAGKPCLSIAGRMIEPIRHAVAGELPETAANSAQAITPASPRPPCQWPTMAEAKLIMRRATMSLEYLVASTIAASRPVRTSAGRPSQNFLLVMTA